jgi:hypothetical protein
MSNDQIAIGVLTGLLVAKTIVSVHLFVSLRRSNDTVMYLNKRVMELKSQLRSQESLTLGAVMDSLTKPKGFDQKTTSLISMAIGMRNENESRNAATEACKRIAKQLGIK